MKAKKMSFNNIEATARNIESAICANYCIQSNIDKYVKIDVYMSKITKERWTGFIKRDGEDFYLLSRVVDAPVKLEESWIVTNGFELNSSILRYNPNTDKYELTITCKIAKN